MRQPHASASQPKSRSARAGAELSARIARGDRAALGEFYEIWFDRLFAQARMLTGRDEAFSLDVVQETMLRVVRWMRPMATDDDVARWMSRIVHTTALDLLRREARLARRHRNVARLEASVDRQLDDRIEWLRERVAELSAEEHGLLWMRYVVGSTLAAAGTAAGMSGDAAHGRIRRALGRLRRGLEKQNKGEKP